ncbi:hypothetical protein N7488_011385 [Penicillium malachiteum]|nr:hypothetical protein N7488_011385 [Penicillium malachiteum]
MPEPVITAAPKYIVPDHGPIDLKQASAAKATNLNLLRINDNREALCDRANGPLFLECYNMATALCKLLTRPTPPAVDASHQPRPSDKAKFYLTAAEEKGAALMTHVILPDNGVMQVILTRRQSPATNWPADFNSKGVVNYKRPPRGPPVVVMLQGTPWIPIYGRFFLIISYFKP